MRNPQGYGVTVEPGKADVEEDTITCGHCNAIVFVKPGSVVAGADDKHATDLGGFCRLCYKHICCGCAATGECTPFEKKLEEMESRDRLRRSILG